MRDLDIRYEPEWQKWKLLKHQGSEDGCLRSPSVLLHNPGKKK